MNANQGFTLLEVLVAVAVLGFALGAIIRTVGLQADNTAYLRQKTQAHWVAQNRLSELQIQALWLAPGEDQGREILGGQTWYWQLKISETPDPDLRRLDLSVSNQADMKAPMTHLTGFLGKP